MPTSYHPRFPDRLCAATVFAAARAAFWLLVALSALALPPGARAQTAPTPPQTGLPVVTLDVAGRAVQAEVARTPQQQRIGLMGRRSLPADHGMLFVFASPQRVCMWMHDTLIPLSVAFIDAQGRVVNIAEMQPLTETVHCAARDVPYALEMPALWFAQHGVGPGDAIGSLPRR